MRKKLPKSLAGCSCQKTMSGLEQVLRRCNSFFSNNALDEIQSRSNAFNFILLHLSYFIRNVKNSSNTSINWASLAFLSSLHRKRARIDSSKNLSHFHLIVNKKYLSDHLWKTAQEREASNVFLKKRNIHCFWHFFKPGWTSFALRYWKFVGLHIGFCINFQ